MADETDSWRRQQLELLIELCPPFEAAAVGGSFSGRSDMFSDLDFFLISPDGAFVSMIDSFKMLIQHSIRPIAQLEKGLVTDFGYQFIYIFPGGLVTEYNIVPLSLVRITPMLTKNVVLADLTGQYTQRVAHAISVYSAGGDPYFAIGLFDEYLAELIKVRKYSARGDYIAIQSRLSRLRSLYLALARWIQSGQQFTIHDSDRGYMSRVDSVVANTLRESAQPFDRVGTARSFTIITSAIASQFALGSEIPGPKQALAAEMVASTEAHLK